MNLETLQVLKFQTKFNLKGKAFQNVCPWVHGYDDLCDSRSRMPLQNGALRSAHFKFSRKDINDLIDIFGFYYW